MSEVKWTNELKYKYLDTLFIDQEAIKFEQDGDLMTVTIAQDDIYETYEHKFSISVFEKTGTITELNKKEDTQKEDLTMLDQFAMAAMIGILFKGNYDDVATDAYTLARKMMQERGKQND